MVQDVQAAPPMGLTNECLATWANGVTFVRTIGGLVLFSVAALEHSMTWNVAGLAVYWGLGFLDGFLARALNQETRFGAQMDILSDRFPHRVLLPQLLSDASRFGHRDRSIPS